MTLALPTTLARTRELVEPALRAAVDQLDPSSRDLAAYHLGWVDADGRVTGAGGKAVRPALALLSARAVGARESVAVPGAVAVELVHNFSLLHDDLMDGDTTRRHRPTVWALHGAAAAILAGDALLALATEVLLDVRTLESVRAARLLSAATRELIRGQFDDVAFEQRDVVTVDECVMMAAGKTGALLACAATIGAVLAGASPNAVVALSAYGAEIGLAFQLVDDLLGIWGDSDRTGKPIGSDLRAHKKSLPITYALQYGGRSGRLLADWMRHGGDSDADIAYAAGLVEAAGGRAWAEEEARRRMAAGEAALASAGLLPEGRDELLALGRFVVDREG
jgi:geranylgeranyl diphosphate synthase, type I